MRYGPVCVIVRSLLLPVFCYRRDFVIGGALLSTGLCYRRNSVIGGALLSAGLCYRRGFVIGGAAKTLYFFDIPCISMYILTQGAALFQDAKLTKRIGCFVAFSQAIICVFFPTQNCI